MYFLTSRNARFVSAFADALVSIVRVIFEVQVFIRCQAYKVFFAASKSLDGISRYLSVNFLILLFFCQYIHTRRKRMLTSLDKLLM